MYGDGRPYGTERTATTYASQGVGGVVAAGGGWLGLPAIPNGIPTHTACLAMENSYLQQLQANA